MIAFPFDAYWWLYVAFTGLLLCLLWIDLSLHGSNSTPSLRRAGVWSLIWVSLALSFSFVLYLFASSIHSPAVGRQLSMEFLAGYIVEESLSVDNMFVFALVFQYFAVPARFQHRVLFYGVLGAIAFRGMFIAAGAALVRFTWFLPVFGVFLIFSAVRLAFAGEAQRSPGDSRIVRYFHRFLPVTRELHGPHFAIRINGALHATPLLVVLLVLESTDIVFATDSVPAVFGVTREPFIVYSSNIFAVLGLRALFFVLSGALERFHLLKRGLAFVLAFIGVKMLLLDRLSGGRFPIGVSLAIISGVIALAILLSLIVRKGVGPNPRRKDSHLPVLLQRLIGAVFLCLAAVAAWCAMNPSVAVRSLPALAGVGAGGLKTSAICAAFCGALLLFTPGPRKRM